MKPSLISNTINNLSKPSGWTGPTHTRARKIVRPTGGIVRGKFPSRKCGRTIHYEGLLERDAIYWFETSHWIYAYGEQPETIHYRDGERLRRYTPDFVLNLADGARVLVEIKSNRYLNEEVRHKLAKVAAHFADEGRAFVVLTDNEIRREPKLRSLKWIVHQASSKGFHLDHARVVLTRLASRFPMSFKRAESVLGEHGLDPYRMVMAGMLACDFNLPVTLESMVDLARGARS